MPTESEPDLDLEIAHVLLIDVVGYSKLLVNDQIELLQQLNQLVRNTAQFRAAEEKGKLMRLPTGDGMALIFSDSAETPVRCALEISQAAKDFPQMGLRMGAHSGPIKEVKDVNERSNFAGAGINIAQRVLDCGDTGHILLSSRVAEDLRSYRRWSPYLHDLGECEVKHGVRLHLFNVCKDGLGNPAMPEKIKCQRSPLRKWRATTERWVAGSRMRKAALILAYCAAPLTLIAAAWLVFSVGLSRSTDSRFDSFPEKSIAVLPFVSIGDLKENVQFADGIQETILTNLSKVADLRVINRWSVQRYQPGTERKTQEIALALRVAYLLDCTVQQSENRVVVHARLIKARTDSIVWGDDYNRELRDFGAIFAIQTGIATQIVAQLELRLSPQEKAAIEERPTKDAVAHAGYVRAKSLIEGALFSPRPQEDLLEGVRLLNQAISRDPDFFLAYYELAHAHDQLYLRFDSNPARLSSAESAIQALQRLRPEAGEAHLARAKHLYWGYRDYDQARAELSIAQQSLPNDPLPALLTGYIDRREGHWEKSIGNFNRALDLDPNNSLILHELSLNYYQTRQFPKMAAILDRAVNLAPNDIGMRAKRAAVEIDWRADIKPLDSVIQSVARTDPAGATTIADQWIDLALFKRDGAGATRALELMGESGCNVENIPFPHSWCEGLAERLRGDDAAARVLFSRTREEAEKLVREQPEQSGPACVLGMADAALGRKDEAIREGQRAVELLPPSKDAVNGPLLVGYLAIIYAWTGEKDPALEQLERATSMPSYWSYGNLRLHPYWDPLRGDPRFDKIVESLAPK